MEIDTRFPTKLNTVSDAPEPLRGALVESLPSGEPVQFLVHAPAFKAEEEKSPATVLAITNSGWLLASENDSGGATIDKAGFDDTLFLELKSILLLGQLKICFAGADASSHYATIRFETVEDHFYREAIGMMLAGIDPALTGVADKERTEASVLETWPMKIRNEAQRYCPSGQRFLAAINWPAISGGPQGQVTPAGALLITERELVVISEDGGSLMERSAEASSSVEPKETFGGIITFVPRVRLADFSISQKEGFDVLALQLKAAHAGEKLEIIIPPDEEMAVSKGLKQMLVSRGSASATTNEISRA
jgi:hypothetical protein